MNNYMWPYEYGTPNGSYGTAQDNQGNDNYSEGGQMDKRPLDGNEGAHMYKDMAALIKKIQALQFAVLELNLYLDTHPRDKKALAKHREYANRLKDAKKLYNERYGPLSGYDKSDYPWQYIKDPWPWEIKY